MPRRIFAGTEQEFIDWCQDKLTSAWWCRECEVHLDDALAHYQDHADAEYGDDVDRKVVEERG